MHSCFCFLKMCQNRSILLDREFQNSKLHVLSSSVKPFVKVNHTIMVKCSLKIFYLETSCVWEACLNYYVPLNGTFAWRKRRARTSGRTTLPIISHHCHGSWGALSYSHLAGLQFLSAKMMPQGQTTVL